MNHSTRDAVDARDASLTILDSFSKNTRRCESLIADFSSGFAKGWAWAVKKDFASALDITLSSRVVKGKPNTEVWTSGRMFSFAKGDIIYDALEAYSNTW